MPRLTIPHDVFITALKAAVVKDKQQKIVRRKTKNKEEVIKIKYSTLKEKLDEALGTDVSMNTIRQKVYAINKKLKGSRRFEADSDGRKGRGPADYSGYLFEV